MKKILFFLFFVTAAFGQIRKQYGTASEWGDFIGGIRAVKMLEIPKSSAETWTPGQAWVHYNTSTGRFEVHNGTAYEAYAKQSDFSGYVPNTGATTPVNLGAQPITSDLFYAKKTATPPSGFISYLIRTESSTGSYGFRVYEDDSGKTHVTDSGISGLITNVKFGPYAMYNTTTGNSVSAFGYNALLSNTTGTGHTVVGAYALDALTTGNVDTAIGAEAGSDLTTGSYNTFIGRRAGYGATDVSRSIFITSGQDEASGITGGSGHLIIGRPLGVLAPTTNNQIWIGDGGGNALITRTGSTGDVNITGGSLLFNGTPITGAAFVAKAGDTMTGALTINKTASSGAALVVNQPDTGSGLIAQWQVSGVNKATFDSGGRLRTDVGVGNLTSLSNAYITTPNTGTEFISNKANTDAVVKNRNNNGSSTGDFLQNINSASTVLSGAKYTGQFYQTVAPAAASNELVRAVDVQFTTPSYIAATTTYTTGTARTITADGTFTITLATTGIPDGMEYCIKNIGTGTITISGTIDGVSGATLLAGQVLIVRKTGSTYIKIN